MKLNVHCSNKNILVVSFVALLLFGLLASTIVAYHHVKKSSETAIQKDIQLKASFVLTKLTQWVKVTVDQVEHFALHLESSNVSLAKRTKYNEYLALHPNPAGLQYLGYILDSTGYYNINDWQAPPGYDVRERGWYKAGKTACKAILGQPYISIESNKQAWLAVTSPIIQNGEFVGLASAHVTFDYILSVLNNVDSNMVGSVFLVDQNGEVVLPERQNIDTIWQEDTRQKFIAHTDKALLPRIESADYVFHITQTIEGYAGNVVFATPKKFISKEIFRETFELLSKFLFIFILVLIALYLSNRHILAPLFDYLELDNVTQLPSKKHFKQQVKQQFLLPEIHGRLLIINMENFNRITASYSAAYVSLLQNKIKDRIQAQLTTSALLGNFSESRYIAYYQQSDSESNNLLDLLSKALAERYEIAGSEIYCNFRIGASDYPEHGGNIETLIDNAFSALSGISRQNCNNYSIFTSQINQEFSDAQRIHNAMKKGLRAAEFSMVYQPQVDVLTDKLFAVESLVRWYSNSLNRMVSPAEFIPIAESNGLMNSLGDNIIRQVFHQVAKWNKLGINVPSVSINISPQQLLANNFYDNILVNINYFNIKPSQIEFEITETSLLKDPKTSIEILNKLNHQGFSIAIDDFGTGYSSLEYLNSMPLHKLKIDRAFVVDLDKKEKSAVLVKTIIAMANNLGLEVLAEGVERQGEAETLLALGCNKIQGYLYSKPLSAEELEAYIAVNV